MVSRSIRENGQGTRLSLYDSLEANDDYTFFKTNYTSLVVDAYSWSNRHPCYPRQTKDTASHWSTAERESGRLQ